MCTNPISIKARVRAQPEGVSRGTKRRSDDVPQSLTQPPSPRSSPAPNRPAKRRGGQAAGARGIWSAKSLEVSKPAQGAQAVGPPSKSLGLTSATSFGIRHPPTRLPKGNLKHQRTQYHRRGQGQQGNANANGNRTASPPPSSHQTSPALLPTPPTSSPEPQLQLCTHAGLFHSAQNFTISNPMFYDTSTHTNHVWHVDAKNHAMQELAQHSLVEAEYDSSARETPPRCHPGTRLDIIGRIEAWSTSPEHQRCLLWLRGPAGAGKSAIMQTIAEMRGSSITLGATLFFSKTNDRANPHCVIPTLAYQLAIRIPHYRDYVSELIDSDPSVPNKSMKQQFQKLIDEPFSTIELDEERSRLILIDGLDECEDEQAQCELVTLIASFTRRLPTSPLLWAISSRPEHHLQRAFAPFEVEIVEVPIDGSKACEDVERYLRGGFARIRDQFIDVIPLGSQWPSERQFLVIARAAGGSFIYATTVLSFLGGDSLYGDPVSQLDALFLMLEQHRWEEYEDNPFASLDALYTHILLTVSGTSIPTLHRILGFHLLKGPSPSISLMLMANILDMKQNVVYSTLQRLHSVLAIPQPQEANKRPLRFLHKSFSDYLVNSHRSKRFWLDMGKQCIKKSQCYIQKLTLVLDKARKDPATIPLSWAPPTETDLNVQLLREVKQNWYQVVPIMFTKWNTSNHEAELGEFLDVFEGLDFSAFDVSDALGFVNLMNWIAGGSFPPLWNRVVEGELPPEEFDVDWVDNTKTSTFFRTKPHLWGYYTTDPGASQDIGIHSGKQYQQYFEKQLLSKTEFFANFLQLKKNLWSSPARVLIVGSNPSRRCAVILTPEDKQGIEPVVRYYLPLVKDVERTWFPINTPVSLVS